MSLKGVDKEFAKLYKTLKQKEISFVDRRTLQLVAELKKETPVDTGEARDSWIRKPVIDLNNKVSVRIVNIAEHIKYLNAGSSKQAPAFFIEKTALKYGKALGAIVEVKE